MVLVCIKELPRERGSVADRAFKSRFHVNELNMKIMLPRYT